MPRETEFVAASKLQEGDEMPRYGTVTRVLNDSTVLSVDTTDPPYGFTKSQHAPMERYVRDPNGVYGLEWCRQQAGRTNQEEYDREADYWKHQGSGA